jgi:hypothetical protein
MIDGRLRVIENDLADMTQFHFFGAEFTDCMSALMNLRFAVDCIVPEVALRTIHI